MKPKNFITIALILSIILTSCSGNGNENAAAEAAATEPTAWADIYDKVLNGENELGIDFYNYSVGDETNISEIRQYVGCGLYDLDSDGVPELFVRIGGWERSFEYVFTVENNAQKYVGEVQEATRIEKSTGVLFGIAGESGYTPDIAYTYAEGELTELTDYVSPSPIDGNFAEVILGEKTVALDSQDVFNIKFYDRLEEAVNPA